MAEQKAKPAAKKTAVTKAAVKAAVKPKTAKAAATAMPKKAAVKKAASVAAKPKSTKPTAVKKAIAPAAAVKKAPAQKAVTGKADPAARKTMARHTPEERYRMVQTAAYFIAERHGFDGCATDHWAAAEVEIANKLGT